jgi:hypothetical protein
VSFDVFAQRFVSGEPAPIDGRAVREVLESYGVESSDTDGFAVATLPGGAEVELDAKGIFTSGDANGCSFLLRSVGAAEIDLVFRVARAGDMVVYAAAPDVGVLLTNEAQRKELPESMLEAFEGRVALCASSEELARALGVGFAEWASFRDRVMRGSLGPPSIEPRKR